MKELSVGVYFNVGALQYIAHMLMQALVVHSQIFYLSTLN